MFSLLLRKINGFVKKVFLVVAVYVLAVSLFIHFTGDKPIKGDSRELIRKQIYTTINNPEMNKTKEGKFQIALYQSVMCSFIGEGCTDNPTDGNQNFKSSVFGRLAGVIAIPMKQPPASGVYWAFNGLQNTGFVPNIQAAPLGGIGFEALGSFRGIWIVFRNLAYLLFVLIIIALGFMIMFRSKIGAQAEITIETILPRIVIALLLITFSYPIAGFAIDLMYITIGIIVAFLSTSPPLNTLPGYDSTTLLNQYFSNSAGVWGVLNPVGLGKGYMAFITAASMINILPETIQMVINGFSGILGFRVGMSLLTGLTGITTVIPAGPLTPGMSRAKPWIELVQKVLGFSKGAFFTTKLGDNIANSGSIVPSLVASILLFVVDLVLSAVLGPFIPLAILTIIFFFSIVYIFFRIFFMLLFTYINIILLIFFAPIIIMFEALPGNSAFSGWFKSLLYHLATWPLLILLTLVAQIILNTNLLSHQLWQPPFLFSIEPEALQILVGMGIFYMIPDLVKQLKELSGIKPVGMALNFSAFFTGTTAITAFAGMPGQLRTVAANFGLTKYLRNSPFGALVKDHSAEEIGKAVAQSIQAQNINP